MAQQKGLPLRSALVERLQQNELKMRSQIRNLEMEKETLRYRLESLRKAKCTVVVRREREKEGPASSLAATCLPNPGAEDHYSLPKLGSSMVRRNSSSKRPSRKKSTQDPSPMAHPPPPMWAGDIATDQQEGEEVEQVLRHQQEAEIRQLWEETANKQRAIEQLEAEVKALRSENSKLVDKMAEMVDKMAELVAANDALRACTVVLEDTCRGLGEELSIKEARWAQREELLKQEIQKQWGERYHEWITKADKKMEELQTINSMLQSLLKSHKAEPNVRQ